MGTKPVRLDEDVYERIAARKREDETFSEAIERLVAPPPLSEAAGVLSDDAADELREAIHRSRAAWEERRNERREALDESR